jgi:hypothetical protein
VLTLVFALIIAKVLNADTILIPLSSSVAFGLSLLWVFAKEKLHPAVETERELNSLLPNGARVMGLIPRIPIRSDARRDRRLAIFASVVCVVLCLALISFLWEIYRVLWGPCFAFEGLGQTKQHTLNYEYFIRSTLAS